MIVHLMSLLTIAFSQDLLNYKLYLFRISPYTCCSLRFLWKFFGVLVVMLPTNYHTNLGYCNHLNCDFTLRLKLYLENH